MSLNEVLEGQAQSLAPKTIEQTSASSTTSTTTSTKSTSTSTRNIGNAPSYYTAKEKVTWIVNPTLARQMYESRILGQAVQQVETASPTKTTAPVIETLNQGTDYNIINGKVVYTPEYAIQQGIAEPTMQEIEKAVDMMESMSFSKTIEPVPTITPQVKKQEETSSTLVSSSPEFVGPPVPKTDINTILNTIRQPDIVQKITSDLGKPVTDIAGNIVTTTELLNLVNKAPQVLTTVGKIEWAKNQLSPQISDYNVPEASAYKVWGLTPDQSLYGSEQWNLEINKLAEINTINQLLQFKKDYPSFKTGYEQYTEWYETSLANMQSTTDKNIQWGLDVDFSGTIEPNEYFTRETAISKLKELSPENLMLDVGGISKSYKEIYEDATASYKNINSLINEARVGAVDIIKVQELISAYEEAGYGLEKTESGYQFTQLTPKETYEKIYGDISPIQFGLKQTMSLGIPALFNVGRWEDYEQEEYARMLQLSPQRGESGLSYTGRFLSSPEAIESIWIPTITMGVGYGLSALGYGVKGGTIVGKGAVTGFLTSAGSTGIGKAVYIGGKSAMIGVGIVGGAMMGFTVAETAMFDPEHLGTVGGHMLSGLTLGIGGWTLGKGYFESKVPEFDVTPSGQVKADVRIKRVDFQVKDTLTNQGNIGTFKAQAEVFWHGKEAGTGLKQYFTIEGTGTGGKSIGEFINVSRSQGFFRGIPKGDIQAGFEAYGFSGKPISLEGTDIFISPEKFHSAVYGKIPDVYSGRGLIALKKAGFQAEIPINVGTGKADVGILAKTDITSSFSTGSFESSLVKGKYVEIGLSNLITGFGEEISINVPRTLLSDTSAYASFVRVGQSSAQLKGSIISNIVGESVLSGAVSAGRGMGLIGAVAGSSNLMGLVSTVGIMNIDKFISKTNEINIPELVQITSPKVSEIGIPKVNQISIHRTSEVTIPKTDYIVIPKTGEISIPKADQIVIPKTEINIIPKIEEELINIPKTEVIVIPKTGQIVMPKEIQMLVPKIEEVTIPKMIEANIPSVEIPTVVTPVPPVIPFIPFLPLSIGGGGSDWGWGDLWGRSKRYREALIGNPFENMELDFGFNNKKNSRKSKSRGGRKRVKKRKR